jgi:hypothetical protein
MSDNPVDITTLERIKLESPHAGFDSYLVVGDNSKVEVLRVPNVEQIAQPEGPPPAPVWNAVTGKYELPA